MPEGPELRLAAKFVNAIGSSNTFSGSVIKSDLATKHQHVDFRSSCYSISAESRGKELKIHLKDHDPKTANSQQVKHLLFRFGMSGCFKFHKNDHDCIPKHAHLRFTTKTGTCMLSFVDYRRFGRWYINEDWGGDRGPDIFDEYNEFRTNILENLDSGDFNRPICETMLNQKWFNGVGNYLRAEVLFRAGVAPFERARDVLALDIKPEFDILLLCNIVMNEVMNLGGGKGYDVDHDPETEMNFTNWLRCYTKEGMNNLVDSNGRTIWFQGKPGPLKPQNSKSRGTKNRKKAGNKTDDHDYTKESPLKIKKEIEENKRCLRRSSRRRSSAS